MDGLAYRIAHLSDPHLAPLPRASPAALASKRIMGFLSWQLRRRRIHRDRTLQAVCADMRKGTFDHVAVTGDLANISLPAEFDHAAQWLATLGPPDRVTVIPGNHDAYVDVGWRQGLGKWAAYMTGDDAPPPAGPDDFPFVRRRGPVALVGLSTAQPSSPVTATGALGAPQLAAVERILSELARQGLFRLVLIHHPPQQGAAAWRKRLRDAEAFRQMLGRAGAELVLHGHLHRPLLASIATPRGPIPVLGVASASTDMASHYGAGGYQSLSITRNGPGWQVDVDVRQLVDADAGCRTRAAFRLDIPAAP